MSPRAALALALLAIACVASPKAAPAASAFSMPLLTPESTPRLVFAQRAITRTWGPSEDSLYVEYEVPGWKSEGGAGGMSLLVPGSGQAYVGEGSWIVYALIEVVGWTANLVYSGQQEDKLDEAHAYAGAPTDTASAWSFQRWQVATGGDPDEIATLWAQDEDAFYQRIAYDPAYSAGWRSPTDQTRGVYLEPYDAAADAQRNARLAAGLIVVNHLVSAYDALRAARRHNLALRPNLGLRLESGWSRGPSVKATLVRRF